MKLIYLGLRNISSRRAVNRAPEHRVGPSPWTRWKSLSPAGYLCDHRLARFQHNTEYVLTQRVWQDRWIAGSPSGCGPGGRCASIVEGRTSGVRATSCHISGSTTVQPWSTSAAGSETGKVTWSWGRWVVPRWPPCWSADHGEVAKLFSQGAFFAELNRPGLVGVSGRLWQLEPSLPNCPVLRCRR